MNHQANENLGLRIATIRKAKGLSQVALAQKIGIAQKLISDYELSKIRPNYEVIIKLALTFDITTDELLGIKTITSNHKPVNNKLLNRMKKIEALPLSQQKFVIRAIDSHLKLSNDNLDNHHPYVIPARELIQPIKLKATNVFC